MCVRCAKKSLINRAFRCNLFLATPNYRSLCFVFELMFWHMYQGCINNFHLRQKKCYWVKIDEMANTFASNPLENNRESGWISAYMERANMGRCISKLKIRLLRRTPPPH